MMRAPISLLRGDTPSSGARHGLLRLRWLGDGAAALVLLLSPVIHHPRLRLVWNVSASVPRGLYRIEPGVSPEVGDLVAVRPSPALMHYMSERRYVDAGALLVKPVAAMGGATVCRSGFRVAIAGRQVARALPRDRLGRPLPRWSGCRRLRDDELFLIALTSAASFDSRYFGVANSSQMVGRAIPLWTWL